MLLKILIYYLQFIPTLTLKFESNTSHIRLLILYLNIKNTNNSNKNILPEIFRLLEIKKKHLEYFWKLQFFPTLKILSLILLIFKDYYRYVKIYIYVCVCVCVCVVAKMIRTLVFSSAKKMVLKSPWNQNESFLGVSINMLVLRLSISQCAPKQWQNSDLEDISIQSLQFVTFAKRVSYWI